MNSCEYLMTFASAFGPEFEIVDRHSEDQMHSAQLRLRNTNFGISLASTPFMLPGVIEAIPAHFDGDKYTQYGSVGT